MVLKNRSCGSEIIDGQQGVLMTILYAKEFGFRELGDSEGASGIHGQYIIQRRGRRDGDFITRTGLRDYFDDQ